MYGTGRIHCESSLSVNYHRAINRAEKEPLDDDDARPLQLTSFTVLSCACGWGECDITTLALLRGLCCDILLGASTSLHPCVSMASAACIWIREPVLFFAHFGTSTFLLLYKYFEQLCVVPI